MRSKGERVDVFDGLRSRTALRLPPAAGGLPDRLPVRGAIAGARKPCLIDIRLEQDRLVPVEPLPIRRQLAATLRQRFRRQMGHLDPRRDQEPRVRDHVLQMGLARLRAPPDPLVACGHRPGRGAERQRADPALIAAHQVAHLAANQRTRPQVVVRHQIGPLRMQLPMRTGHRDDRQRAQLGKRTPDGVVRRRARHARWCPREAPFRLRKVDEPATLEVPQRYPTAGHLGCPVVARPVQPAADGARELRAA